MDTVTCHSKLLTHDIDIWQDKTSLYCEGWDNVMNLAIYIYNNFLNWPLKCLWYIWCCKEITFNVRFIFEVGNISVFKEIFVIDKLKVFSVAIFSNFDVSFGVSEDNLIGCSKECYSTCTLKLWCSVISYTSIIRPLMLGKKTSL